jgi:hypothetical protein
MFDAASYGSRSPRVRGVRRVFGIALLSAGLVAAAACSSSSNHTAATPQTTAASNVQVVSSRPDMVTGEQALLQVLGGTGTPTVTASGKPLTVTPLHQWWLVTGIAPGPSTLTVTRGSVTDSVAIVDSSIKGPVFSGPHMPLLACATVADGLGPATDADCSAPTKVDYLYGNNAGALVPLASPSAVPADAKHVTINGKSVPFVVRREKGVINRSVYWIDAIDPGGAKPASDTTWNGRLVYRFGGGCGTTYGQGGLLATTADAPDFLSEGYAVATATFNTFQTQCNDVLSAETAMMVKSHFIEEFGVPVHTIGEGASGGAIQQHLIIQNYPGILDASIAILPFPDAISISAGVADCGLLDRYYRSPAGASLTADQRAVINGHAVAATCVLWENSFLEGIRPSDGCDSQIPKDEIYDPKTNRTGIRCDLADGNVNQLGRDPATGFADRPLDNIGVQYGLNALNDKKITVDQFLDLNAAVGGYDVDGTPVAQREQASEAVLKNAYAKGRVSEGGGDQKVIPLIDLNIYDDTAGDIHDRFRAFSLRERLQSPNFVIWTRGSSINGINGVIGNITSGGGGAGNNAVPLLDQWLTTGTMPASAVDNCPGANGTLITGPDIYTAPGPCRDNYPLHNDPRTAAGAPLRNDILKCQLQPTSRSLYKVPFSAAQLSRLGTIFPQGVCDWTRPGVGQVPLEGTWLHY